MKSSSERLSAFHKGQILTEGMILVREDICDWINELFKCKIITGDTFLNCLSDGIVLCDLSQRIYQHISSALPFQWPTIPPSPDRKAITGSFKARDNISLFLQWCRKIGLKDTILFETKGLMNNDEEKNIVLTLLHIGEICVDFEIPVPQFAKFYKEMMIAKSKMQHGTSVYTLGDTSDLGSMESGSLSARSESNIFENLDSDLSSSLQMEEKDKLSVVTTTGSVQKYSKKRASVTASEIISGRMGDKIYDKLGSKGSQLQLNKENSLKNPKPTRFVKNVRNIKNEVRKNDQRKLIRSKSRDFISSVDMKDSLTTESSSSNIDLKIKEIVNRCKCHTKFMVEKTALQEGMYKIGSRNLFVRMFRGNVMLRVGGGWETLNEYLNKVDPCCKNDCHPPLSQRRQSMVNNFSTDLTAEGLVGKNLRKLSQYELTTVKKKVTVLHDTICK